MLGPVIKRCAKMRGTPGMDNIIRDTTERDAPIRDVRDSKGHSNKRYHNQAKRDTLIREAIIE